MGQQMKRIKQIDKVLYMKWRGMKERNVTGLLPYKWLRDWRIRLRKENEFIRIYGRGPKQGEID